MLYRALDASRTHASPWLFRMLRAWRLPSRRRRYADSDLRQLSAYLKRDLGFHDSSLS